MFILWGLAIFAGVVAGGGGGLVGVIAILFAVLLIALGIREFRGQGPSEF